MTQRKPLISKPAGSMTDPMIDLMATLCVVLFLVLIVAAVTVTQNKAEIDQAKSVMLQNQALREENIRLKETLDKRNNALTQSQEQVAQLKDAAEKIAADEKSILNKAKKIISERTDLYEKLCASLRSKNIDVVLKGNRLILNTAKDYDTGSDIPKDGGEKARNIGIVLAQILDQNASNQESQVHIAYIEVTGHTDLTKGYEVNDSLGVSRAYHYVDFMLKGAVSTKGNDLAARYAYGKFFKAASMSMYEPLKGTVTEQSPEDKEENRRIEIRILFTEDDFDQLVNKDSAQ